MRLSDAVKEIWGVELLPYQRVMIDLIDKRQTKEALAEASEITRLNPEELGEGLHNELQKFKEVNNMAKGFGISPITNTIYYGKQDPEKHMWTGKKEDVTDAVIAAVYEWFMGNMDGKEEFSIRYPSTEFELVMRRKKN